MLAVFNVADFIKWFTENVVNPISEGPIWLAILVICIGAGWILKRVSIFPNQAIPAMVVLLGGLLNIFGNWDQRKGLQWAIRNFAVGMCVGFFAWIVHRYVIKWAIQKVKDKFPSAGGFDTDSFNKPISPDGEKPKNTETETNKKET